MYSILFTVLPYLTYRVEIWGNIYPTNINGIVLLQKNVFALCIAIGSHKSPFTTFAGLDIS